MGLLTALGPLAIDMYLPAFPAIVAGLGTTQGHVERTLASYLFGLAIAQLFYGPFADRYGRKKPLIFGLIVFITASAGCGYTDDIDHLTLWRIAQAFGGAAGMVIPRAVIRDNFDTRDASKALSILLLVMGVTPILAPILGGQVLALASWRGIFAIMGGCALALLVAVLRSMRETLDPDKVIPLGLAIIARNYVGLLRHRRFMCYTLAGGFGSAGMFAYIAGSPRVFIELFHVDPRYFGLLFGLNAASLIIASQVSARLLSRHVPDTLLRRAQITLVAMTLVALALTLTGAITLWSLMLCLMGFMASQGFVNPNAAALALSEQGHRLGVASALMGTLQMLCGATAGLAVSLWQSSTPLPLTGMLALCAALSWLFGRAAQRST
ncbi:Bcr/CflA family multidrug efflux MFS transporter [Parapusillimonas sp. SGNA-6]|nr:Bcr/CflA family multidrug efflux MFS transporter [Parapusillimonas sp. SGNA-6]